MSGSMAVQAENAMINRACEIFVDARKDLGDDLKGFSLVDLIADNSGYPLKRCRDLAMIVVERCECSERLRIKYGKPDPTSSRIADLAQVAYHGYCVGCGSFAGGHINDIPAWDEVPDRVKRGWRSSVVELLLEYQAGAASIADPGETIANSEHHFSDGEISGISMRMVESIGRGGSKPMMIIERDIHENQLSDGVERLSLSRDEALDLTVYLAQSRTMNFWRD